MRIRQGSVVGVSAVDCARTSGGGFRRRKGREQEQREHVQKYEMVLITKIADPWFVNMEEGLNQANSEYGIHAVKFDRRRTTPRSR